MPRQVSRLLSETNGAVAGTVALSLFALVAIGGVAFDYARMATLDTELQNAADQAALAAASQLDGGSGACARAVAAARSIVTNNTLMADDIATNGIAVTIADSTVCNINNTDISDAANASVRFFVDKAATTPATTVAEANFVQVVVNTRRADFALTPIVAAFTSGDLGASARAGMGTALCKVPPLMICSPSPGVNIDWNARRGQGIRAAAISGNTWSPGGFGYLGPNDTPSTQIGLAFVNPVFSCQNIETGDVNTGNPTPAVTAINTRFDVYAGTGNPLNQCTGNVCQPAKNVTKDLVRSGTYGNCRTSNSHGNNNNNEGWHLPDANRRFWPEPAAGTDPMRSFQKSGQPIDAMGLPRDNCHYLSYDATQCGGNRFGNGQWARGDYFNKYHAGRIPVNASTMTRYDTYLWEIANNFIPVQVLPNGIDRQEGIPVCRPNPPDISPRDRRVLQVAVGGNCDELSGSSSPVEIDDWVEMFFVEPGVAGGGNGRGNGDTGMEIYLEVIREVDPGGNAAQVIRRDVPYLVR